MRKQLLEVIVQRLQFVRHDGQRRVIAHRARRFFAGHGHWRHEEFQVFLRIAERLLAVEQGRLGFFALSAVQLCLAFGQLDLVELDAHGVDPRFIGLGVGVGVFQFLVVDDAARFQVDQEHFARLQAPFLDDFRFGNRQYARFRRHHHEVVVRDDVAGRTQAVAVQGAADVAAIRERHGGRAVPRFHHGGVVFVEGAAVVIHRRVVFPRFRNHHHHRLGDRIAGHQQQFERIVEARRVGLAFIDQGEQLLQVVAQHGRLHHAFARAHPVEVAFDRVDLAVVGDQAVRVGQRPFGEGIRRETLVDQGQGRDAARVLQVLVVYAHLVGQQQAFIDDGAGRHRWHEEFFAVQQFQGLDGVARRFADHIQFALERVGDHDIRAAADEDLANDGFLGAHGRRHRHVRIDGHVAPAQYDLSLDAHGAFDFLFASDARCVFLRQEDHAHAVFARRRQFHALLGHFFAVVLVGNLDQDAGAIAHQRIGAHGAPVIEVFQYQQTLFDDRMGLVALDMGDETDAAGIVFIGWVVQALRFHGLLRCI
ncbi:hypothetical protein D3C85_839940 [compost metagenome]